MIQKNIGNDMESIVWELACITENHPYTTISNNLPKMSEGMLYDLSFLGAYDGMSFCSPQHRVKEACEKLWSSMNKDESDLDRNTPALLAKKYLELLEASSLQYEHNQGSNKQELLLPVISATEMLLTHFDDLLAAKTPSDSIKEFTDLYTNCALPRTMFSESQ